MLGAIIGDTVGSRFEWHNIKTKTFSLFTDMCHPTDDTAMTLAVAKAILECEGRFNELPEKAVAWMRNIGRHYPHAGYGRNFYNWIWEDNPQPYGSFGNGAAMRVSPCGYAADTLEGVRELARAVTGVTHNHKESYKAAEAVAGAVFLARTGATMDEIRAYTEQFYHIDFTLDDIRPTYCFDVTCMGSVPQALEAFYESDSFEDAIRNAISVGGDSDTIAAITGAIAGAYYPIPKDVRAQIFSILDDTEKSIFISFAARYNLRPGNVLRSGHKRDYKVITLCGSTRFKDEFLETQKRLTLEGNIVISVGLFGHSGDSEVFEKEGVKEMLDDMHKRKIDMADEIYVINVGGYIGSSTRSEIAYAEDNGKPVRYLEPVE